MKSCQVISKDMTKVACVFSFTTHVRPCVCLAFCVWQDALELTRTRITPTVNRQGRVKRKPLGQEQFGQKVRRLAAVVSFFCVCVDRRRCCCCFEFSGGRCKYPAYSFRFCTPFRSGMISPVIRLLRVFIKPSLILRWDFGQHKTKHSMKLPRGHCYHQR